MREEGGKGTGRVKISRAEVCREGGWREGGREGGALKDRGVGLSLWKVL